MIFATCNMRRLIFLVATIWTMVYPCLAQERVEVIGSTQSSTPEHTDDQTTNFPRTFLLLILERAGGFDLSFHAELPLERDTQTYFPFLVRGMLPLGAVGKAIIELESLRDSVDFLSVSLEERSGGKSGRFFSFDLCGQTPVPTDLVETLAGRLRRFLEVSGHASPQAGNLAGALSFDFRALTAERGTITVSGSMPSLHVVLETMVALQRQNPGDWVYPRSFIQTKSLKPLPVRVQMIMDNSSPEKTGGNGPGALMAFLGHVHAATLEAGVLWTDFRGGQPAANNDNWRISLEMSFQGTSENHARFFSQLSSPPFTQFGNLLYQEVSCLAPQRDRFPEEDLLVIIRGTLVIGAEGDAAEMPVSLLGSRLMRKTRMQSGGNLQPLAGWQLSQWTLDRSGRFTATGQSSGETSIERLRQDLQEAGITDLQVTPDRPALGEATRFTLQGTMEWQETGP